MADTLAGQVEMLARESRTGMYDAFFAKWARLRGIQASVDFAY